MEAILTRRSGATETVDVFPARQGTPAEVIEAGILKAFNSLEGAKLDPLVSVEIVRRQKPLRAK